MNSRDQILARVRRNAPFPRPLPVTPTFDDDGVGTLERFRASLLRMGGKFVEPAANGDLEAQVRAMFPDAKVIASAAPEVRGDRPLKRLATPADLHDVDVGVVRAAFGVAETGSVWLSEQEFEVNALGFLSQHLVVLLDRGAIMSNMHRAYQDPRFAQARYCVFMTGPSATADIEGVLIHGAQGIRSLTVIPASQLR